MLFRNVTHRCSNNYSVTDLSGPWQPTASACHPRKASYPGYDKLERTCVPPCTSGSQYGLYFPELVPCFIRVDASVLSERLRSFLGCMRKLGDCGCRVPYKTESLGSMSVDAPSPALPFGILWMGDLRRSSRGFSLWNRI